MDRQDYKVVWIVMLGLLLLTRLPAMANYLSIDNINLALSLEKFDPRVHQPQPPGYPFFVAFGRLVNFVFRDAQRTFVVIPILVTGLSLLAAFHLGSRMFSPWAGVAGAFLLLVNPVAWHSDLDGPLRPTLALFSLLTAYCCWRCWNGEKQFALWGAVALGIGSGFRPDLGAYLFPVWLISSWIGTKSWRTVLQGIAVLAVIVALWLGALVIAMEGIANFRNVMFGYAVEQSRGESVVLGSSLGAWLRQVDRLVIWNGLAIIGWIWAVPFYFRNRDRVPIRSSQSVFLFLWLVPGLIVQALIHIAAPGHTLFSVPAFCILGGYILSLTRGRDIVLASALIFNVMLFLDYFPLPTAPDAPSRSTPSIKNAFIFGTFESSIGQVRFLDDVTRVTLKEIRELTPADGPSVIISTDMPYDQWFMPWQIGRYYLPRQDFWVLYNKVEKRGAERFRRDQVIEAREGVPVKVPILRQGRILWLIEPNGAFHKQLAGVQKLGGGPYVFYSDITQASSPFSIDGFEFVPSKGSDDHGIQ
ncbi:MAG TPA: glycosyltransferase family 39 protein [Terriglobia bacterium]|nr:glycosyltransferase family 39 protein [Terriglobia bacterium]